MRYWQVGFLYDTVAEDFFTGFILHCKGWTSVYCNPSRAQFLGSGSANLNDLMIQGMRWSSGLIEVAKLLQEILFTGGSFLSWVNEQRIWMMKSVTFHLYGTLDGIMKLIGIKEASFVPSNKVEDDEQLKLYEMGKFGFQIPNMFLVPMVALIILNMASFVGGLVRVVFLGDWDNIEEFA
ncbi:cellulose synthase-like protein g2 [Quercus suber]|uniref:Cellulose synthase-like protein g2 n=1 Tax=Quercus suber TaxID=58331 RepID=A0AAW0J2S5_QUESU